MRALISVWALVRPSRTEILPSQMSLIWAVEMAWSSAGGILSSAGRALVAAMDGLRLARPPGGPAFSKAA